MIMDKLLNRKVIIVISILVALVLYFTSFDINSNNIEAKLGDYLNESDINVIEVHEFRNEKDLIALFKTNNSYGVVLLHKGLNNKYIINNTFRDIEKNSSVSYKLIGDSFYTTLFNTTNNHMSTIKSEGAYPEGVVIGTWRSILVTLACVLIVILTSIITSIIFNKFNKDNMTDYNKISTDGQRIKQSWFNRL